MLAVVEIAGMQFEVKPHSLIRVPLLKAGKGDVVSLGNILLANNNDITKVGTPYIDGSIEGTLLYNGKDEKVLVFKKKKRKGYRKLNGHRQHFSTIEITKIDIEGFERFNEKPIYSVEDEVKEAKPELPIEEVAAEIVKPAKAKAKTTKAKKAKTDAPKESLEDDFNPVSGVQASDSVPSVIDSIEDEILEASADVSDTNSVEEVEAKPKKRGRPKKSESLE